MNCKLRTDKQLNFIFLVENFRSTCARNKKTPKRFNARGNNENVVEETLKACLQPFTVLFSFSAILVCFIDAQIHSCFREKMSGFERQ